MTALKTLQVVETSLRITVLGFGCARLFAGSEARASAKLVEAALEGGIRHFDTAPSYSGGQSEEVLGEVLAGVPDATITTKVGIVAGLQPSSRLGVLYRQTLRPLLAQAPALKALLLQMRRKRSSEAPSEVEPQVLPGPDIRRSLEQSLRRLRRTSVDILLVHEPQNFVLGEEARQEMDALVREGAIKAYGLGWGDAPDGRAFGQVQQFRFQSGHPPAAGATCFLHGVLRSNSEPSGKSVQERIRSALETHTDAGIIFSASHPNQIKEVLRAAHAAFGARV